MHPMDLIKTRFQLQSNELWCSNPHQHYTGIGDCMRKVNTRINVKRFLIIAFFLRVADLFRRKNYRISKVIIIFIRCTRLKA